VKDHSSVLWGIIPGFCGGPFQGSVEDHFSVLWRTIPVFCGGPFQGSVEDHFSVQWRTIPVCCGVPEKADIILVCCGGSFQCVELKIVRNVFYEE